MKRCTIHILLLLHFISVATRLLAQREADNWSCNFVMLNFGQNANDPVAFGPINGLFGGGSATMSDKNGQLLFYSDGNFVFNRLQQRMPALSPFVGGLLIGPGQTRITSQGTLAVPFAGNDSLYYLFYIRVTSGNLNSSQLFYAVIDMRADGGLGDVVQRDIPLLSGQDVCLKLNATLHCNKKDIWVVGHVRYSDKYYALQITAAGINPVPVYSTANFIPADPIRPSDVPGLYEPEDGQGCLKISALGDKLAAAHLAEDYVELCDFNNQTGVVTNPKKLFVTPNYVSSIIYMGGQGAYGVEFSPSSQKLYVTSNYEVDWQAQGGSPWLTGHLHQFTTTAGTEAAIQASRFFIDSASNAESFWALQLANNGKIYCNTGMGNYLSRVANPEGAGFACGYNRNQVYADGPRGKTFPTFLQSYFRYPIIATGNCQFQNISFNIQNPIGVSSIAWDFGDPASGVNNVSSSFTPTHIYTTQGIYTVKAVLQNSNGCGADTIKKVIHAGPFKVFLGNDTTICKGDTLQLKMSIPGGSNFWHNNSFDTTVKITQPGKYWVRVSLGECAATDTIEVFERNLPQFTLGADTLICNNTNVTLAPNPSLAGGYTWSNNAATPTITVSNAGNYWLQVTDNIGCKWRDTIGVSFKTLPNFSLGNDTAICQKDTLVLNATVSGATGYTWNTGATTPQIKAYQTGIYWCDVNKQGCLYRDSLQLTVKSLPIVNLGNDTTLCENTTLLLDAQNPGSSWLWNTGSMAQTYLVSQVGFYKVSVTKNNCINKDSINIAYELKPRFTLGANRLICPGEIITLQPALDPFWQLLWQDGSRGKTYSVAQPGLYYLDATTRCGTTREDIIFTRGLCKVNIPNAFTPNGDGRNDVLKALGTEVVTNFNLKIFNRYGQLVFESKDKNIGWDGRFCGQRANNGAYTYICTYRELNGIKEQLLKGTVLVMR